MPSAGVDFKRQIVEIEKNGKKKNPIIFSGGGGGHYWIMSKNPLFSFFPFFFKTRIAVWLGLAFFNVARGLVACLLAAACLWYDTICPGKKRRKSKIRSAGKTEPARNCVATWGLRQKRGTFASKEKLPDDSIYFKKTRFSTLILGGILNYCFVTVVFSNSSFSAVLISNSSVLDTLFNQ